MKKIISIVLICIPYLAFSLSGLSQIKMEKIYDNYRIRYIEGQNAETQSIKIKSIQKALKWQISNPKNSASAKSMYDYLRHLFCEAESIINGLVCDDAYLSPGPLTTNITNMSKESIRSNLIAEHSKRRIDRGLGWLKESKTLSSIAQKYAESLCSAWYISHELNGSKLENRYDEGGYNYSFGGENLGSGQTTVGQILDQLTTSLHHRENMYEAEFREIGVGQCRDTWVLNYGTPAK
jgi:uncharacterized protein YkwD